MTGGEVVFGRIVVFVMVGAAAVTVARNAYGKRHWIAWKLANFLIVVLALLSILFLVKTTTTLRGWWIEYVAMAIAGPLYGVWEWKRSRWIPVAKRRKVIKEWEARTGRRFDPQVYEVDHMISFARGGWHTTDNLRIVRKEVNRRKGNKEPTLEDWFRTWSRKDDE